MKGMRMTDAQNRYVKGIATDFEFDTIDDVAVVLGFEDAQQMASAYKCKDTYEMFTGAGFASRYLTIERLLDETVVSQR